MKARSVLVTAGALGAISVAIGAFGAHGLKELLIENGRVDPFETAVRYQFYHTLALLAVGILMQIRPHKYLSYAAYAYLSGILIFSGSLYVLCVTNITILGAITPIGGLFFIAGWLFFLMAAVRSK